MRQAFTPGELMFSPDQIPNAALGGGGLVSAIIAAIVLFRRLTSRELTDARADRSERDMIGRLSQLLNEADKRGAEMQEAHREAMAEMTTRLREERERADRFAAERNESIKTIGELKGKIEALTQEVRSLKAMVGNEHSTREDEVSRP